ncbi:OmpH family outer membrane protein [Kangiella sp. HZ709]|uniref:OmpH family outer membrane protein n=1 Tax=Kangiella sp. HZ709 TaxID=2666328 RepID=UPI0012B02813|nr:OmpH family outer membrane protein [Kangiella sp. HZ709]MRX28321.1 OmpH family outer membrane protein [Kangiella sp. HZ709]
MNKVILVIASVLSLMSFSAIAETRIATVNTAYVQAKAPQNDTIGQRLKSQFSGRENEIKRLAETIKKEQENFTKNSATMSESQLTNSRREIEKKMADFQLKQKNAKDDFDKARRDEAMKLNSQIKKAIDAVAVKGGFNLVIERQAAVFTDVSVPDLTEQVLAELKK